jgi:hypothetical protein
MEQDKIPKDEKKKMCMIIDASVIQQMIEDDNSQKAVEVLKKIKEIDENPKLKENCLLFTPQSSLLRAIYFANPEKVKFQNLQKIISCVMVTPSFANFKNEKAVIDEVIRSAKIFSGEKNES